MSKKLVQFTTGKIVWQRVSWKRFSAKVGSLHIEVRFARFNRKWYVGEVFGSNFLGPDRAHDTPETAAKTAITVANNAISRAARELAR